MLTNKIYKYIFQDILKNFITILITFATIAWTVRAVNFLDLIIEDGYDLSVYLKYSIYNISSILSRFVPLSILLALTISILKFEKSQEFLILSITGVKKTKIVNIFIFFSILIILIQLIFTIFLNPLLLSKSRDLLKKNEITQIQAALKSNNFNDLFKGVTFFIEKKTKNNEFINIFINDTLGSLKLSINEVKDSTNSIITAEKGLFNNNKLILINGSIQTIDKENVTKNFFFNQTELNIANLSTRTITDYKIQETSSLQLIKCFFPNQTLLSNCSFGKNNQVIENLSRRTGKPLYIFVITIITSFLLFTSKEKKRFLNKNHITFSVSFILLIISEILLKYTGYSIVNAVLYFLIPIILSLFLLIIFNMQASKNKTK